MEINDYPGDFNKDDCLIPNTVKSVNKNINEQTYYSSERGQKIVNALTGYTYPINIGTYEEKLFWRVSVPLTKDGITNSTKLFYESPEEYEQHRNVEVPYNVKRDWRKMKRQKP